MSLHPESIVVSAGRPHHAGASLSAPIVLTAPYRSGPEGNLYARQDVTPTIAALEAALGELEGGTALTFASGMAAIAAVAASRPAGAVAVVPAEAYSGTISIFGAQRDLGHLTLRPVNPGDVPAVTAALEGADLLWIETVSNPMMTVADLPALIAAGHAAGALVGVDATFSTPLIVRPLDLGADVVMHSATKYLGGHSDLLLGALITRSDSLARALHERRTLTGSLPGALEAYLATRGLRTLALRMERAQANALELATRLAAHPRVIRVRYPGLPTDPGHQIAARDHAGFGAMLGFEIDGDAAAAERVCNALRLINHATSLGGVESLIERRARHAGDAAIGAPENLLRLSVGIEHVDDLWADLQQALHELSRP